MFFSVSVLKPPAAPVLAQYSFREKMLLAAPDCLRDLFVRNLFVLLLSIRQNFLRSSVAFCTLPENRTGINLLHEQACLAGRDSDCHTPAWQPVVEPRLLVAVVQRHRVGVIVPDQPRPGWPIERIW